MADNCSIDQLKLLHDLLLYYTYFILLLPIILLLAIGSYFWPRRLYHLWLYLIEVFIFFQKFKFLKIQSFRNIIVNLKKIEGWKDSRFRWFKRFIDFEYIFIFEVWQFRDIKIYKFAVVTRFCNWKSYRLGENLDALSLALWRALPVIDIKTTSMSIVESMFCEFSRRRVLVVRPRDWYGGKWVSSLRPILSRPSRGTPWFVSALKYESPGITQVVWEKSEYERYCNRYSLRVVMLNMCLVICQLLFHLVWSVFLFRFISFSTLLRRFF